MKQSFWLTIPLGLLICTAVPAQQYKSARKHLKHGLALFTKSDVDGAIAEYNRALEADPRSTEAYLNRGKARRAKSDLDGAISDFEAAAEIDPQVASNNRDIAQVHLRRGYLRLDRLDIDGALADFDRAIQITPNDADAYLKRGRAFLIQGSARLAVADFDRSIALDARNPIAFVERAVAHQSLGLDDEAQKDFEHGLRLNSDLQLMIDLHITDLQTQIREMRRRQAEVLRRIACLSRDARGVAQLNAAIDRFDLQAMKSLPGVS